MYFKSTLQLPSASSQIVQFQFQIHQIKWLQKTSWWWRKHSKCWMRTKYYLILISISYFNICRMASSQQKIWKAFPDFPKKAEWWWCPEDTQRWWSKWWWQNRARWIHHYHVKLLNSYSLAKYILYNNCIQGLMIIYYITLLFIIIFIIPYILNTTKISTIFNKLPCLSNIA